MALAIGIVGLPNVGKSTLFNALTKNKVPAENYPFCTIDPAVGVVAVPDERLTRLAALSGSSKIVPAAVEFVDIAGLVKGASEGAGLGNAFLSNIREVDAILHMVRMFDDPDVIHVHGEVNPREDMEVIDLELALADLDSVRKRREKAARDVKRGDKAAVAEDAVLAKLETTLASGAPARSADLTPEETGLVRSLSLLSMKKVLYAFNMKSGGHNLEELADGRFAEAATYVAARGASYVVVDAGVEQDLSDVAEDDIQSFRQEFGVQDDGVAALIRGAYRTLGLISYFTTGPEETRAWTVRDGALAPEAGAAIHGDFKDKFIRAEVVAAADLLAAGSYAAAREAAKVRTEGKEYRVQDGDVIVFLHS